MITLESLEEVVNKMGWPARVVEEGVFPIPRLIVHLGLDGKEEERMVAIALIDQMLGNHDQIPSHQMIVITYKFPFSVHSDAGADTARLFAMINCSLEMPGFQINEIEQEASFRSVLLSDGKGIDDKLLAGTLGTLMRYLDAYSETIERIATNKQSFLGFVDQEMKMLEKGTP